MAKGNVNPTPPPNPAANPTPTPSAPPPTGTGGGGPTGNSGYSMSDSSMQGLQSKAGDLGSRLSSIASGLRGLNFSGNALGPIGLFAVPALNASNDNAVSQADRGAKAFTDVQSGIKATHQTSITTDTNNQSSLKSIDTTTNAKPPPGNASGVSNLNSQGGKVSGPGSIKGGGVNVGGLNAQGGPSVSAAPNVKGGTEPNAGGLKAQGGPSVSTAPNVKGGGPAATGGLNTPGGPSVSTTPNVKGGTGPNAGGLKAQGGPSVTSTPNVKGGGPVGTGGLNTPGGPSVSASPNVKGGTGPNAGGLKSGSGPSVGVTPNVKGGTGPVGATGGPKGPGGPGVVSPPVIGGNAPGAPGSSRPGTPGGKGPGAIPTVPGGATPGGKGATPPGAVPGGATPGSKGATPPGSVPGSVPGGPKAGVTPPGPQSAVTSPSTGGSRGATPPPMAPGMAPPMAPGAPGGPSSSDRGGSKFGTGAGKGVFDAPKPGTPDSTITKAPPSSSSTPPPKPGATPGAPGSPTPGVPSSPTPGAAKPGATPGVPSTSAGVPSTSTPGPQASVATPPAATSTRGGPIAPPPAAAAPPVAPPMAPGAGAAPGAAPADRGGSKFGTGAGKGVFDAPKPPTPDNTITKAPPSSASTPPPAPKPTPLSPPPAANVPPATTPSTNTPAPAPTSPKPAANMPPVTAPGTTPSPAPNTTPPTSAKPAPNMPPANAPGTTPSPAPSVNTPSPTPGTNTPSPNANTAPPTQSPKADTAPNPQTPKADTPPVQTRPTPATPSPAPAANVPPVNAPSPTPSVNTPPVNTPSPAPNPNTPSPNTPPVNTPASIPPSNNPAVNTPTPNPATNVPPANAPSPNTNTPPVNAPSPKPDTTTPPAQTRPTPDTQANPNTPPAAQTRPAPPTVNAPPANTPSPNPNTPPVNTPTNVPGAEVPPTNAPSPNNPSVQTRPAPGPVPNVQAVPNTNPTAAPDLVVAPPVTPAPNTSTNQNTSANPNPASNVVPRSHPAAANYQAQTRPDGGKGKKRAALKKYLGINFIKGLLNKGNTPATPTPAPTPAPNPDQNTTPPNPWADLLRDPKPNPASIDVEAVKAEIDTAVKDGKPANARILINRLQGTEQGAELQAHYDQAVQNKGDAGKVEVPKQLHFAWFGNTPSPESVNGMLEWAAQTNENNGWKATLWTDGSSANWDPAVKQQLADAGIEIKSDVDSMVDDLSATIPPTAGNTTLKDVYTAAQNPDAKAYNLAADIARYAVLAKNGGVYVDVDIRPGAVSLDTIGDLKMQPTDVPLFAPRLRDQQSVDNALQDQDNVAPGTELDTAAEIRYGKGELNNNFIVAPPNNDFINAFAEIIPKKFEGLQAYNLPPARFNAELKAQAPDISGPNVLVDSGLSPKTGLIGQFTMDPANHGLQVKPDYLPQPVPLIQKTDFNALFDPDIKNQWTGLEWVTPESESQLDAETKPAADNKPGPSNDKSIPDSRPAPNQDTPQPSKTDTDAPPKQVRSGGAPPKMTPPTPESHQGKDVITDESWRHDPAKTADWFAPNNPANPSTWADRRDNANVRTVDVVVHDVRSDSTPSNIKSYQGLINYDLRRIETSPGNFVQEYTVKVHVEPGGNVDPKVVEQVKENATNGVNNLLNQGYRLPSGDQFHLNLEFTDNKADAHTSIKVDPNNPNVDQTHWNPSTSPEVLAHETLHYLGIPDEYSDSSRVFQQHDSNSGVHKDDGGMMGSDVHGPDPGLRPRHLWLVERTANSQVMVPDTRLDSPGPATVPPPAQNATANPDADTRPMPKRDEPDSDSEQTNEPPAKRKPAPDTWSEPGPSNTGSEMDVDQPSSDQNADTQADGDVDMDAQNDSQMDNLADQFTTLSLGGVNFSYNPAFAQLANGDIDLPTKDNYLAKLKESVEENKQPSFVVNMIVSHKQLGDINDVITAITADAGPIGKDMVFVVGVNGPNGSTADMNANIEQANNAVASRKEPIALVPLPTFDPKDGFPFGRMRNGTMHSPATTFAIGALNGKGTHPYLSFQDFDTGSRLVTGGQKDVFTHFTDSLNPPGAGPIRPLLYSGGYRVGDPAQLIADTQQRIDSEREKINKKSELTEKDQSALDELNVAEQQLQNPDEFVAKFEQAMRDDMDARSRQKDSAPLLPYSPEPNLFMDASVAVVDPGVKFSDGGNEFGDLSQSINEFAGKELVEIHQNQLPPPPKPQESLADAKAKLETDIKANGGNPSPSQVKTLESLDAAIKKAEQDNALVEASINSDVNSGIDVDMKTNRNPYRGENFTSDFVNGAVGTDLSRLALGFAKSEGKSWPQSHVALTSVTNRMYGGATPTLDRAAKADVSGAKIRDEFQDKKPNKDGTPNPKNKPHTEREAQQLIEHKHDYDPATGVHTQTESKGGWNPSKLDALKLGWEDKNSLNTAVSAEIEGHGHVGIDPQADRTTVYPPKKEKVDGKVPAKTEADVQHIDQTAKQHKMAAMLNLALSANPSNVTRTFGTLEHGVLPIAGDPRPDGMFNAVQDALANEPAPKKKGKVPAAKTATDLRAGAIQKGSIASPAITKQIANFRQEHGLENGHLVNALIEPDAAPQTPIPDSFQPGSGDVAVDNTGTPGHELTSQERADQNKIDDAERNADNAKAAKAEELAAKLLATEIGRPLTIHGPDGAKTIEPFFEPKPEITSKSSKADIKKAENWKTPKFPPPLELDRHPQPNGKSTFTPHDPSNPPRSNDPSEGPSGTGPANQGPGSSRNDPGSARDDGDPGPSTRGAPPAPPAPPAPQTGTPAQNTSAQDTSTRSAPEPEVQTRPAPPRPTPNPVIPMITLTPPEVGQVMPGTQNLPAFFQDNKALGTIAPTDVRGADQVTNAIPNLKPGDAARIQQALTGNFESFLDNGRNFQVKIGNTWYEANVRATMRAPATPSTVDAPDVKVDATAQSGNSSSTTHTVATANDVGGSATAGVAMGPYGSLGGKAQLATPAQSQSMSNSLTDQRAIRAGEGSTQATVPVTYDITLTDANGTVTTVDPVNTGTDVTLQIPNDLATITGSGNTSAVVTPPDAEWGAKIEHPAPEAVAVDNQQKAFSDVAEKLHPSITKVGSPGREALQNFLSPTSIRNNLGSMLGGAYVTSPDLISPHAGKGAAVQMTAKLQTAELVGTHNSSVLRLHETSSHSSGVSSTTKSGFDATAGFGGNIGVPNAVGGQVGATLGYSARTAESVNAGTNTAHRSGIQIKGDTGLYKVTAEVEVRTPSGENVKVPVTTYMRMGLPEAGALGLPTPDGTRNSTVDPATAGKKFPPPYLSGAIAAGNAKVGEFAKAAEVQGQVESALRDLPGFAKFLPNWNDPNANPRSSKGKSFADVAEQLANQRKLTSQLSPTALKTNMDSLMGPGVQVQLKNSGKTTNTYVNITVKAKLTNPQHLGQADARNIRDASSTGPKLDSATTTTKGWSGGVEGKVTIPAKTSVATLTPSPQVGVKYNHGWSDKTAAGPTVNSTSQNVGSPDAQVFRHDVEFEVEITTFTRPRSWVRRIVPGAPGFHSPEQHVVAKTGTADTDLKPIKGEVNLWVSDSSTLDTDPGNGFKPGDPEVRRLKDAPTVKDLLSTKPKEKSPDFLHVEAVANTTALRDQAIDALNRAAGGDSALTVPGTASRAQIDKMFSPENIKANLRKLTETGMQEPGLKYDRRVTDRTGAIGMSFQLSNPQIVSISDNTGTENANTGGYKASESSSTSRSVDITGGVNVPIKPNPAAPSTQTSGSGGVAVVGKVTPWSDSKSSSNEIGGSVDRNFVTPSGGRTVLVQLDADVTVVGESRAANFVHGGTPKAAGATVNLPKSVFVRVTEDVARDMGLLPDVQPNVPKPDFPKMAPPATVNKGEPSSLGLSTVESVPDLSAVVADLTQQVNGKTAKRFGDPLVPNSVLKDSMSNLQRIVDFSSPASVKAMIDSAMDGGVPLLVHQPGTFGKDSFQVTLRAKAEKPQFQEVVNDGVEMESTLSGSQKVSDGQGRGTGWGAGIKAPGLAAPGSANRNASGTAGVIAAANIGQSKSTSVTNSTTDQFSNFRGASGPAARYAVPVEFELVVEKGNKVVATAGSGKQDMVVRLHADNQKVAGALPPLPYAPERNTRTAVEGTAAATNAWQHSGNPASLPPAASVENLRGAQDLRNAAIHALKEAGAGKGLTGKGTGALNSLLSTLSPENLQPHLPGMLSGPLDVPGLHEAALTFGQDADVKVYAKLVDPSLGSLSDGVALENPKSQVSSTSGEAKVTESGDVSVGLATGGAAIKQNTDPKDNVSVAVSGVELRHAAEDSSALSGGPTDNLTNNLKPKTRTGLVQFGVEYRVVATIGGKTAVVDLSVPNSAAVRMPAADAQTVLGHEFSTELTDAQTEVKKAADDWRKAEVEVDAKRHEAQQVINDAAAKLARNDSDFTSVQIELNNAIEKHLDEQAKIPPLEARAETARREVARTRDAIGDLMPQASDLALDLLDAQSKVDDARADVDATAQAVRSLEDQLARTPDADGLQQQVNDARQAHADAEAALQNVEQEADAAQTALDQVQQQIDDARAELDLQRQEAAARRADLTAQERAAAQADAARAAAETKHEQAVAQLAADRAAQENRINDAETALNDARRNADAKQQAWWDAKAVADEKIADYNHPPATTSSSSTDGGPDTSKALPPTPPPDTSKDLPPLPPNEGSSSASSSRSAPPPLPAPSTSDTSADADVPTELDNQLSVLTADAMAQASPLAKSVESKLESDPRKFVQSEAGLHLLRASVVLDTKTDEIAAMIEQHGVEAVARSFNNAFERPIIETAQLQQFADISNPDTRGKFDDWAHQLWGTVTGSPDLTANPDKVAADIFNHDKGYNRAFNFAQEAALESLIEAPALNDAITGNPVPANDPYLQAMWLHQVLSAAQLIPSNEIVSPEQFTQAVNDNKTALGTALGIELDDAAVAGLKSKLQDDGMVDDDPEPVVETRPAPQPPNSPGTSTATADTNLQPPASTAPADTTPQPPTSTAPADTTPQPPNAPSPASTSTTDTTTPQAPTSVPSVVIESHLKALTADAMLNASPLAKQVETALTSNTDGRYVQSQAGLDLLRASVVLDTKADDIAVLIQRHGVEAVARAFNREFGRPIIETAQLQQFADLKSSAGRAAFDNWAHQLWGTIGNTPSYAANPDKLAADIFNHDKGYNRGTNFAQQTAYADMMGAPELTEAIAGTEVYGTDPYSQALWTHKVLSDAQIIPSDALVSPQEFTQAVTDNKADLEAALGVELTPDVIADFKIQLQGDGMVDDDPEPESPRSHQDPVPPSAPATELDTRLADLTADAMANASPLAQLVEITLQSDARKYVQYEAGLHLLHASVVLHTKTDQIAALIEQHGVEAVAKSFNKAFERPIIETAQLQQFGDLSTPESKAKFHDWAHQLWNTVNSAEGLNANPTKVAADIFNHDKGYNRAFNFAQEAALEGLVEPPTLDEAMRKFGDHGTDPSAQAMWLFQVLGEAKLIPAESAVSTAQFTAAVNNNLDGLPADLALDDAKISELAAVLDSYAMLDDTPAPSAPPADHVPGSQNPLHSTATSAPWFDPQNPVSSQAIADARATTPASSWVRGEDGGVLATTAVGPHGINMQAWRGPIAYDNRVMNVDGVPVRDFTVRLHLQNGDTDVQARTRAGVEEMYNQGYRLPNGEQFHVTVEFTDNPGDAHATVNVTNDPEGRANQLTWPANTDSRRLAHEVGHFLGLRDEYLETGAVKPVFQHQDGKGRVVGDNSPMTAGIDRPDAHLKPRHLQLIEDRMKALESHNRPKTQVEIDAGLPAPNMPKRERPEAVDSAGDPSKRRRDDDHVFDPGSDLSDVDSDVEMGGVDAEVRLVNENGVHNAAFANLAGGQTLTPITAANYLDRTRQSIANNEPPAFVVSMIVRASEVNQLDDVINGVMANTNNMNGRVAFVLGVNAPSQQAIDDALAAAAPTVSNRAEPIALVSVPHGPKGFKFGDTRNRTLTSNAHEFAVTALAANGTYPYVSIMDFDAGDRRTREGGHVFDHVTQLMDAEEVGPADGPDTPAPLRPLLVGGGYRVAISPDQLKQDVLDRITGDSKTTEAQKAALTAKLNEEGFVERFTHLIDADMHARRNQQGIHPLLPYTPEPNLFFDALVPLADPSVKFGEGAAEFGQLGQSLNKFYAKEVAALHTPADPADLDDAAELANVDVQNNRHPVRGQAFSTDFVSGDTGTDLSRIAYGLIKDGKLPQSHTALPNVSERFFDGKSSKAGTKFADERERLTTGAYETVEPLRPPAEGQTTNTWNPPRKMETQLGAPAKNRLNPAVSAPLPAPFTSTAAGIQKDQKVVAAHGLVASDHVNDTLRQLRYLSEDVLRRPSPPPTTPDGLYAAIGHVTGTNPAALRQQVVNLAAGDPTVAKAVADFTVSRPMHHGHLYGALVENLNWSMRPEPNENRGAGNARDLVGHLIATQLGVTVRIHQPGGNPVVLAPMGGQAQVTVDLEMAVVNGQVTYRPRQ